MSEFCPDVAETEEADLREIVSVLAGNKSIIDGGGGRPLHTRIGGGISAGIGNTDTRLISVVSADTDTRYWYQSQPNFQYNMGKPIPER